MAIYTVLAPPPADGGAPDPTRFVFVKEGFCWPALIIPELWLLFRTMWLVFLAFLAVSLAFIYAAGQVGDMLSGVVLVLARLLFALEANGLRRWTLERRGYRLVGVVQGRNAREAEIAFTYGWQARGEATNADPTPPPKPPSAPPPTAIQGPKRPVVPRALPKAAPPEGDVVVGLFPKPGNAS